MLNKYLVSSYLCTCHWPSEELREDLKVVEEAGSLDSGSGHSQGIGPGVDLGQEKAYIVHTDCQVEEDNPGHSLGLMDVDNLAGHWVWVLHTQDDPQGVVGMSHKAVDKAVLLGTDQEGDSLPVNLVGTDLGDMADGTLEPH